MTRDEDARYLRSLEQPARRVLMGRSFGSGGGGLSVSNGLAAGQSAVVNAGPINFTVRFSEVATGFTNSDVSFADSTVGGTLAAAVTGAGPSYNVAVTGMTGSGTVTVSIPAASATNATGKPFPSSGTATVMYDAVAPTVTIDKAVGQADPTSLALINFAVTFSEAVFGFTASDVSTASSTVTGTLFVTVSGSGAAYNVAVMGATGAGNVVITFSAGAAADAAGNTSAAPTIIDNSVAFDTGASDWPVASNTGVPAGTVLTTYTGPSLVVTNGTQIINKLIIDSIEIAADSVVIRNCRIENSTVHGVSADTASNLTVDHCDIIGSGGASVSTGIIIGGGTATANDISNFALGMSLSGPVTARDNYIHDLFKNVPGTHYDGVALFGGENGVLIEHNAFWVPTGATGSVFLKNVFGPINNVTVNNNLMRGTASYTVQVDGTDTGGTLSNISFTNNKMEIGQFGYFSVDGGVGATNITGSGNVDYLTSAPITFPGTSATAAIAFQAAAQQSGAGPYSIALTVAAATGQERLVALCGIANGNIAAVTFTSVTIGGQAATQVGSYVRGLDGTGNGAVLSLWRAAGTASTSINVAFSTSTAMFDGRCALWTLTNAGTVLASTSVNRDNINTNMVDMPLNVNTAAGGVVAAAMMSFNSPTHVTTWTGVTERFDGGSVFGNDWYSVADAATASASTPLNILVDLPADYPASANAAVGIAVAFNHT